MVAGVIVIISFPDALVDDSSSSIHRSSFFCFVEIVEDLSSSLITTFCSMDVLEVSCLLSLSSIFVLLILP